MSRYDCAPTGGIDLSGTKNEKTGEEKIPVYIVMVVVRCDIFLVQIAIMCHRIPCPSRVSSDPAYVVPVVSGTRIVYHAV